MIDQTQTPATKTAEVDATRSKHNLTRQGELIFTTVLMYLIDVEDKPLGARGIPVDTEGTCFEFIDKLLQAMKEEGYLKIFVNEDPECPYVEEYVPDTKGYRYFDGMKEALTALENLEVFAKVAFRALTEDEGPYDPDEEMVLYPYAYRFDPRFPTGNEGDSDDQDVQVEDLRLAMMTYLAERNSEKLAGQSLDTYRVVFLQMLGMGEIEWNFDSIRDNIWLQIRLGHVNRRVEEILSSAYQWRDMCPDDEDEAARLMANLFELGMIQVKKAYGDVCVKCGASIALADEEAARQGTTLTECPDPDCRAPFTGGEGGDDDESYEEEVVTTTTVVEEEEYDSGYGGYYFEPDYVDYTLAAVAGVALVGAVCYTPPYFSYDPFYNDYCW